MLDVNLNDLSTLDPGGKETQTEHQYAFAYQPKYLDFMGFSFIIVVQRYAAISGAFVSRGPPARRL